MCRFVVLKSQGDAEGEGDDDGQKVSLTSEIKQVNA